MRLPVDAFCRTSCSCSCGASSFVLSKPLRTFRAGAMLLGQMNSGRITRRSLMLAAAGALAGRGVRPAGALAALAGPAPAALFEQQLGALSPGTRTFALTHNADLLGLAWHGARHAHVQLRFRDGAGRWSPWASAAASSHGPDSVAPLESGPRATVIGEPVWAGGTRLVQLRSDRELLDARLHIVDASGALGARAVAVAERRSPLARLAATSPPIAAPVLHAGPGQPPIIARSAWALGSAPPKVAPEYGAVRMAFVHHTENPNGYLAGEVPSMLRAIFAFHRYVRGWNDIGYNFVIDAFGRIFEARAGGIDEPVCGAQAGGYNLVSSGVAVLGSFSATPISPSARHALTRLLAWKLSLHGVPTQRRVRVRVNPAGAVYSRYPARALVSLPRIAGHRDGDSTDCPGDALYSQLQGVRAEAQSLAQNPVRASLALSVPPGTSSPLAKPPGVAQPPSGEALAPATPVATPTLFGSLTLLDGTPLAGASVQLQQRSVARRGELVEERTLAQVTTDAAGRWSLPVALAPARPHGQLPLRALYAGSAAGAGGPAASGASVSEPLVLTAAALTPQPAPAAPATPAPPTPAPPTPAPPTTAPGA